MNVSKLAGRLKSFAHLIASFQRFDEPRDRGGLRIPRGPGHGVEARYPHRGRSTNRPRRRVLALPRQKQSTMDHPSV